jgi:hypothetical protein
MLHIQEVGILVMAKNLELNLYNIETNKTDIYMPIDALGRCPYCWSYWISQTTNTEKMVFPHTLNSEINSL